jgi:hypothetical protein
MHRVSSLPSTHPTKLIVSKRPQRNAPKYLLLPHERVPSFFENSDLQAVSFRSIYQRLARLFPLDEESFGRKSALKKACLISEDVFYHRNAEGSTFRNYIDLCSPSNPGPQEYLRIEPMSRALRRLHLRIFPSNPFVATHRGITFCRVCINSRYSSSSRHIVTECRGFNDDLAGYKEDAINLLSAISPLLHPPRFTFLPEAILGRRVPYLQQELLPRFYDATADILEFIFDTEYMPPIDSSDEDSEIDV